MKQRYADLRRLLALLPLLWLLAAPARAQEPTWTMAASITQDYGTASYITASTTDAAGNVYVVGYFYCPVALSGTTLVGAGQYDAFVAKWSPTEQRFVWAEQIGGEGYDYARAVAVQGSSVYVAGTFNKTVAFGDTTLTATGDYDMFITKLTDEGTRARFGWARWAGGGANMEVRGLAVQGNSVYATGMFRDFATFGKVRLSGGDPSRGGSGIFVTKLTDTGPGAAFTWVQQGGNGASDNFVSALAVSGSSVYLTGTFRGTMPLGTLELTPAATNNYRNVYVAKLTDAGATGAFVWAQQASGCEYNGATGLVVQGSSVYIGGFFADSYPKEGLTFGSTTLHSEGNTDIFVAKLTDAGATGAFVWVRQAGSSGPVNPVTGQRRDDNVRALAVRGPSVYLTGECADSASFGTTVLRSNRNQNIYVAKLTDTGASAAFAWATGVRSTPSYVRTLAVSGAAVYVGGEYTGAAYFGPLSILSPAAYTGYLASLTDADPLAAGPGGAGLAGISLFPNPAHGRTTVQLPAGTGAATLTLLDALGRAVRTCRAVSWRQELDLTGVPAGLYALRVQAGRVSTTRRLVVD